MAKAPLDLRLLLEGPLGAQAAACGPRRGGAPPPPPEWLSVDDGLSFLVVEPGRAPRLTGERPSGDPGAFVLELARDARGPSLLLVSPNGQAPLVNGRPAPPVALLDERDEVRFEDSDYALHVTTFAHASTGPVPEAFVGKTCLLCRSAFKPGQGAYLCYHCGLPLHLEGEDVPEERRLLCASLSSACRRCARPVALREGYTYLPEL